MLVGSNQTFWNLSTVSHSEARLHCTKQAFELSTGLLQLKSALLDSYHAFASGMGWGGYLSTGKTVLWTHKKCSGLSKWQKRQVKLREGAKHKVQVKPQYQCLTWTANLHDCQGNLVVWGLIRWTEEMCWTGSSKRQRAHPRLQGPWQQKQQYQKVRNSFLQDKREGDAGGTLIGSAAVSLLLLTQPRWRMCYVWTRNFYSQLFAPLVGHEGGKKRQWQKKERQKPGKCRRPFMSRYEDDIQHYHIISKHPLLTEMKKDRHREHMTH